MTELALQDVGWNLAQRTGQVVEQVLSREAAKAFMSSNDTAA